jgi:hypothetical protein
VLTSLRSWLKTIFLAAKASFNPSFSRLVLDQNLTFSLQATILKERLKLLYVGFYSFKNPAKFRRVLQ